MRPNSSTLWPHNHPADGEQHTLKHLLNKICDRTPNNTDARSTWLWGDGSLPAIIQTITNGVPHPKEYRGVMPPMGGAQLSPSEVSAVAAYVWALSHQSGR